MIPLFIYQGSNQGEQPGQTGIYYGQTWTVTNNGSLETEVDQQTAMNLLLNHNSVQIGTITSDEQQAEVNAFTIELDKQKRIIYLQQLIAAYTNELNDLPPENSRREEINQLIASYQLELNQLSS